MPKNTVSCSIVRFFITSLDNQRNMFEQANNTYTYFQEDVKSQDLKNAPIRKIKI